MNMKTLEKQNAVMKEVLEWIASLEISTTDHQKNTLRICNIKSRAAISLEKANIINDYEKIEFVEQSTIQLKKDNKMKNKNSRVALIDRYQQQVQGIGATKQDALEEAKTYLEKIKNETVESIDENDRVSGDPRFSFVFLSAVQERKLNDDPAWNFGEICDAPSANGVEA